MVASSSLSLLSHSDSMDSFNSLSIHPYQLLLLVNPLDGIQCLCKVDECKFLLVGEYWCAHVLESIRECCFRVCPFFSSITFSSYFTGFPDGMEVTMQLLFSRVCLKWHTAFLCWSYLAFFCMHFVSTRGATIQ